MNAPRLTLGGLLLAVPLAAQYSPRDRVLLFPELHSRAVVNDARSHGTVGDRWLSLSEAILLNNRQLDSESLSADELRQLQGFGTDIAWADIDATAVPVLRLERDLPVMQDTPHGLTISGAGGRPRIELGDTRGFVAISDFVDFDNLELVGGDIGIHITQADTLFGSLIDSVEFEGQGTAGLQLDFTRPNGFGRIQLVNLKFRGLPIAIRIEDEETNRTTQVDIAGGIDIVDCRIGIDVLLGPDGQHTMFAQKTRVRGAEHAMRFRRLAGATGRDLGFEGRYLDLAGSATALTIDGHPGNLSNILVQSLDLTSPLVALRAGGLGTRTSLVLQDSRVRGAVDLSTGATGRVQVDNLHHRGGSMGLGSSGAGVTVANSVLEAVATGTTGSRTVQLDDSRVEGGSLQGSAGAALQIQRSFVRGSTVGSQVTVLAPISDPPLGTFDAIPTDPRVGTILSLATDLPPRLAGLYMFGLTVELPTTLPGGLRTYIDLAATALITVPVTGQQTIPIPVPNSAAFVGLDLFFHLAVSPDPGLAAPPVWLPPGRRVTTRA